MSVSLMTSFTYSELLTYISTVRINKDYFVVLGIMEKCNKEWDKREKLVLYKYYF